MENKIKKSEISYLILIAFVVFVVTISILYLLGLTPKIFNVVIDESPIIRNTEEIIDIESNLYTRPDKIVISKIGVDSVVNKPESTDVAVLDQSLLTGTVHYPGSGSVERGNMFIFGHSANVPVRNPAYEAFNDFDKLKRGDDILIEADGKTYIYKVNSVTLVNEDDALIVFDSTKRTLTLSTCNTFGKKQERWVVEAEFYQQA